jgi:hypothetical protein
VAPSESQRRIDFQRADQTAAAGLKVFEQRVELLDQFGAAFTQKRAFFRELQTARRAVHQLGTQFLFQLLQALGHRRR